MTPNFPRFLITFCMISLPLHTHAQLEKFSESRPLMGTHFTITLYAPNQTLAKNAIHEAFSRAESINNFASDYDATSETSQLNQNPSLQEIEISPPLAKLLEKSLHFAQLTHGRFDPTLGSLTQLWRESKRTQKLPSPTTLKTAKSSSGWQKISLRRENSHTFFRKSHPALRLDFGAIGKGYANDEMAKILQNHQISRFCLTSGGDVLLGNPPPNAKGWRVLLPNQQTLTLKNCAISTSGSTHQQLTLNGQSYSHIINPHSGLGLHSPRLVTILAKNATTADALATASTQISSQKLAKSWGAKAIFFHFPKLTSLSPLPK